jgi:hypothetical protein
MAMLFAAILALAIPERGQLVAPFACAAIFGLFLGATTYRIVFGRWW